MKKIISSKLGFFSIAAILLWLKSHLAYLVEFNLDIQNSMQQFLLLINPISSMLVFLGIALFAKGRNLGRYIIGIYTIMTIFLYANVVFYRFNSDFITFPVLTQTGNFGCLGSSIISLLHLSVLVYFIYFEFIVVYYIYVI